MAALRRLLLSQAVAELQRDNLCLKSEVLRLENELRLRGQ